MKITHITRHIVPVNVRGNWVFVRVFSDAGRVGIGEASHSGDDEQCVSMLARVGEALQGRDPLNIQATWDTMIRWPWSRHFPDASDRVRQTVVSAIEQALWDLLGQEAGMPVHQLLGGAFRDSIPLYANINRGMTDRTLEGFVRRAEGAVAEGFKQIKISPFDEVQRSSPDAPDIQEAIARGLERVAAVRRAVGEDVDILIDCHCCFDLPLALQVGGELAALDVYWFEDPTPRHSISVLREVQANVRLPVAAGETFFGLDGFRELLTTHACAVAMPDVKHCGGIAEARKVAVLAEAMQTPLGISPHNPAGPVSTAASLHVCAATLRAPVLEYQWNEVPWRSDLISPPERVTDGALALPDGPGLGIRLNEALLP
jgi:galactonate dehydratase